MTRTCWLLLVSLTLIAPATAQGSRPTSPRPTRGPAKPDAVPARDAQPERETPEQQLDRLLKTRQITLNFDETPLEDALDFLRDISGLPIVAYPGLPSDVVVTLRLRDISLRNALKLILASHDDLDHAIWAGAVVVKSRKTALPPAPRPNPQAPAGSLEQRLWAQKLTLDFTGTPAREALDFLRDISGMNIVVTRAAQPKVDAAQVTLRVRGMDMGRVLSHLTQPHGLRWSVSERAITIDVPKQ